MNIEAFVICDAATDSQGKMNILGAFDTIFAKVIPTVHPQCSIAIRLRFNRNELGKHVISVHIISAEGKAVIPPFEGNVNVEIKGEDASSCVNMIMNIQGLKLETYGEYAVRLLVDGQEKTSLPVFIKRPQ